MYFFSFEEGSSLPLQNNCKVIFYLSFNNAKQHLAIEKIGITEQMSVKIVLFIALNKICMYVNEIFCRDIKKVLFSRFQNYK